MENQAKCALCLFLHSELFLSALLAPFSSCTTGHTKNLHLGPVPVCKEPPYKVEESGCTGFLMPIEVYFKNKEKPKKVSSNYDLFLNLEGNPPVNHLRCEKLTFNNPTREFRRKLVKAGGVMVAPEETEAVSRPSPE